MSRVLVRKLFWDLRGGLLVVALLLGTFQFLYSKVTEQTLDVIQKMESKMQGLFGIARDLVLKNTEGGEVIQKVIGGDQIDVGNPMHTLSIGYVHPLIQTILCIWAIGRAASAIAGEIDRGTMELLLAQPVAALPSYRLSFRGGCADHSRVVSEPVGGNLGGDVVFRITGTERSGQGANRSLAHWTGAVQRGGAGVRHHRLHHAVVGLGRRARVLGVAVVVTLIQFMVNLIGQLWDLLAPLRPFTVFYYYQPQPLILGQADALGQAGLNLGVLFGVGLVGYLLALVVFCRRDLPAPL